jgi:hypothetical protein
MLPWRQWSRVPNLPVPLAEGLPGRADLARRRAITLQVGSPKDGSGTGSEPLLAITAGQAADIGLCRPPVSRGRVGGAGAPGNCEQLRGSRGLSWAASMPSFASGSRTYEKGHDVVVAPPAGLAFGTLTV